MTPALLWRPPFDGRPRPLRAPEFSGLELVMQHRDRTRDRRTPVTRWDLMAEQINNAVEPA